MKIQIREAVGSTGDLMESSRDLMESGMNPVDSSTEVIESGSKDLMEFKVDLMKSRMDLMESSKRDSMQSERDLMDSSTDLGESIRRDPVESSGNLMDSCSKDLMESSKDLMESGINLTSSDLPKSSCKDLLEFKMDLMGSRMDLIGSSGDLMENGKRDPIESGRDVTDSSTALMESGLNNLLEYSMDPMGSSGDLIKSNKRDLVESGWDLMVTGKDLMDSMELNKDLIGSRGDLMGSSQDLVESTKTDPTESSCKVLIESSVDLMESRVDVVACRMDLIESKGNFMESSGDLVELKRDLMDSDWDLVESSGDLKNSRGGLTGSSNKDLMEYSRDLMESKKDIMESRQELIESRSSIIESQMDLMECSEDLMESKGNFTESSGDLVESEGDLMDSDEDLVESSADLKDSRGDLTESSSKDLIESKMDPTEYKIDPMESSESLMGPSNKNLIELSQDLMESKGNLMESRGDLMECSNKDLLESSRVLIESISYPQLVPCKPSDRLRVMIDGSSFEVDRMLLSENSEYFRALFQSGMRESQQDQVLLRCVGVLGFLVLLQVLDGDRPMLNSDQIVEAIECAAFLQVPALAKHLINITDSENCLLMYHTASTFGVWDLFHSSALFIRDLYPDLQEEVHALPCALVDYIESLQPRSYLAVCSHSPSSEQLRDLQRTVCYLDESSRDWRVLTHLPVSSSTTMAGVVVLDNKLYIIGGVHDVSKTVIETGFCYCPAADTWTTVCSPQQLRYNFTLIGHESCLFALGGESSMKTLSSVEKFRVSDGSWSYVSPLPSPAAAVVSAMTMNRIFICLWRGQGATDIHEYVPEQDQWKLITTLVRQNSYGLHMVAHKDNLYVMRNGPCEDFLQCVMDRYSLSSGQWTAMSGLYGNSKSSLFTAVVRGDSVFTLSRQVTTEFTVEDQTWRLKRQMKGFGRIGSIYTFLMRLPETRTQIKENSADQNKKQNIRDIRSCLRLSRLCPYDS